MTIFTRRRLLPFLPLGAVLGLSVPALPSADTLETGIETQTTQTAISETDAQPPANFKTADTATSKEAKVETEDAASTAEADMPEETDATTARKRRRLRKAEFASNLGNDIYLAGSVLLPLVQRRANSNEQAYRTALALSVSTALAQTLKAIVRRERPGESTSRSSFPSGHAAAAFAAAGTAAAYQSNRKEAWYLGAIIISESRVPLRAHYFDDVLAGAALGYATARWLLPDTSDDQSSFRKSDQLTAPPFIPLASPLHISKSHQLSALPYSATSGSSYGLMITKDF